MSRKILGPFNRVEGDLAVNLTLENGRVAQAQVTSPLYRGFERALVGRPLADALVVVPRICGICSVSQSVAAVRLMQALSGARPAANGERVMNIVHACENLADHLTHFYLFFAPDLAHADYADQPWHADWAARLASGGPAARQWLAARGWRAADYYRLWCTKEALIKAAGLDFPADLPHAGVCRQGGHAKLHIGGQSGWQGFAGLCGGWALACVWPDWASPQMRWQYFGTLAQPQHTVCKVWHFSPE